jgi:hypothetical protein
MAIKNQKLAKIEEILNFKEDFISAFEKVIGYVKEIRKQNEEELDILKQTIKQISDAMQAKINNKADTTLSNLKGMIDKKIKDVDDKLLEIRDGEDSKDANEQRILEAVKKEIKLPTIDDLKNDIPGLAEQIRNALELLQGDERLDKSAIKGLDEELKRIEEIKGKLGGGGGGFSTMAMNIHILDPYEPTGDINGVNTDFVLSTNPNPTASLKVYLDGQKMKLTTDYTLSDRTITFLTAPLTGSSVEVEHRV